MKRKTAIWIAGIAAVLIAAVLLVLAVQGALRYGFLEGRVLVADNGVYLIILEDHSPVVMTDRSKEAKLFRGLQTGDRIRILHDGIRESYPGQADVYRVRLMEKGSAADIPESVLRTLEQLGWLGGAE